MANALGGIIYALSSYFIKIEETPKGRILEKFLTYIVGMSTPSILSFISYIYISNTASFSYLEVWALSIFIVHATVLFAIVFSVFLYVIESVFKGADL